MKVLITGADGFIGSYLMEHFAFKNIDVWGTYYYPTIDVSDVEHLKSRLLRCDVRYFEQFMDILNQVKPDLIFHMAAQSYPALSWKIPIETLQTNIIGTANLFEAIKLLGLDPVVVVACSSAEYGIVNEAAIPVKESHPLLPLHPYGISKVAVDLLAYSYWVNDKIKAMRARIFNTTGPRKVGDVCSDFTYRIVMIEKGKCDPTLKVGNLGTYRAFLDVRDLVRALVLLSEKGRPGDVYNVSGHKVYQIQEILDIVLKNVKCNVVVEQDPTLLRSSDEKIIYGDSTKLIQETGWRQEISIEDTIKDMLEYWRRKIT
jgi:GDP-4-dehydro-6-deoxy-D-mannose reductase